LARRDSSSNRMLIVECDSVTRPLNKLAVIKDSLMQVGASLTRSRRSKKHIQKIGKEDYEYRIGKIIAEQEMLQKLLDLELEAEIKRVKSCTRGDCYA